MGEGFYTGRNLDWNGLVPGLLLLGVSIWKKQAVGIGDAVLVLACGWALGWERGILVAGIGFFLAGITGIIFMGRKKQKRMSLPFAPFLLVGYLIGGICI